MNRLSRSLSGNDRRGRRSTLALLAAGTFAPSRLFAQAPAPEPLPAAWLALGIAQWPQVSPELKLEFDEIVVPGTVTVQVRTSMRFVQSLLLFRRGLNNRANMEQIALVELGAKKKSLLRVSIPVTETEYFVALAKTSSGWFQQERQIKVGRVVK